MKSRDLPLHWFDLLFRRTGAALAFGLCAARVTATLRLAPSRGPDSLRRVEVLWPVGIYALQTLVRGVIYWLHAAGEEGGHLNDGGRVQPRGAVSCGQCLSDSPCKGAMLSGCSAVQMMLTLLGRLCGVPGCISFLEYRADVLPIRLQGTFCRRSAMRGTTRPTHRTSCQTTFCWAPLCTRHWPARQ